MGLCAFPISLSPVLFPLLVLASSVSNKISKFHSSLPLTRRFSHFHVPIFGVSGSNFIVQHFVPSLHPFISSYVTHNVWIIRDHHKSLATPSGHTFLIFLSTRSICETSMLIPGLEPIQSSFPTPHSSLFPLLSFPGKGVERIR